MVLNEGSGGTVTAAGGTGDGGGLIAPRRLINPCLESSPRQDLHRELMFNQKMFAYLFLLYNIFHMKCKNINLYLSVGKMYSIRRANLKELYPNTKKNKLSIRRKIKKKLPVNQRFPHIKYQY